MSLIMIIWYQNGVKDVNLFIHEWCQSHTIYKNDDAEKLDDTLRYNERRTKIPLPVGKNRKATSLMKDQTRDKTIAKFVSTVSKTHGYRAQKDQHEIEECELIKSKRIKKVRI